MWLRFCISALAVAPLLAACSSAPPAPSRTETPAPVGEPASTEAQSTDARTTPLPPPEGAAPAPGSPGGPPVLEVPPRVAADFERAVKLMRAGNTTEAELEFQQLAVGYPQFAAPLINLGLLHRKAGRLEEAKKALSTAVERNPASAAGWNELGVTLRMLGEFRDAASAYERAIAAEPDYAPAHRNLGVVLDLYLGEPDRALDAFERYQALTGEDKPVSGWIAELRQRTGRPAPPKAPADSGPAGTSEPDAAPPDESAPSDSEAPAEPGAPPARAGG